MLRFIWISSVDGGLVGQGPAPLPATVARILALSMSSRRDSHDAHPVFTPAFTRASHARR
jgi:hypothetical protein